MRAAVFIFVSALFLGGGAEISRGGEHRITHFGGGSAAGAKVTVVIREEKGPPLKRVYVTDKEGRVVIELGDINSSVSRPLMIVEAEGAATGIWRVFPNEAKGATELILAPSFDIRGTVVTEEGKAVDGANVRVAHLGNRTYVPVFGDDLALVPGFRSSTDDKGHFRLKGATLNGYRWAPGAEIPVEAVIGGKLHTGLGACGFRSDSKFFEKPLGDEWDGENEEIKVFETGPIRGRVTHAISGKPVEGAEVEVWNGRFPDLTTTTDGDGRFVIERSFRHGRRSISISHPEFAESRFVETKPRAAGDGEIEMNVTLRPMIEIRGRVVDDASGKPHPTPLSVSFESYEPGSMVGWKEWWGERHHRAPVDAGGDFTFRIPVGKCRVSVGFTTSKGPSFPFEREFSLEVEPGGKPVELRLMPKTPR